MTHKKRALVKSSEVPPTAATNEGDATLAAEVAAGRRLKSVVVKDGAIVLVGNDEAQRRVMQSLGTESRDLQSYMFAQLLNILPESGQGDDYAFPINAAIAMLSAINPQNELEAMLAVQMVACNHLALMSTRRANSAQTVDSRQMNGNLATKFSRTFIAQLEALDRHRRGGKQIVEHVHVNAGGQAVIAATVNTGRGG